MKSIFNSKAKSLFFLKKNIRNAKIQKVITLRLENGEKIKKKY